MFEILPLEGTPRRVEVCTAIRLPSGRFLKDGFNISVLHLEELADLLEEYLSNRVPEMDRQLGDDTFVIRGGGTDWAPRLLIYNTREGGGSMAYSFSGASALIAALRKAARKYTPAQER